MSQSAEFSRLSWDPVHVPPACMNTDIVVGIDEAGRGPVLGEGALCEWICAFKSSKFFVCTILSCTGSLVYCAAFWPASMNEEISRLGFDDSKVLSEEDREGLFKKIRCNCS